MKTFVNLGCGHRFHPAWTNYDLTPRGAGVIACDLSKGIPRAEASCEVVYHSAVLEHIRRTDAPSFLRECHRVLKPGGIIRVAVPDLEKICQLYLAKLPKAVTGDAAAASDYDWLMIELFDQTVREQAGGEMLAYLRQNPLPNEAFVYERIGEEGHELVASLRAATGSPAGENIAQPPPGFFRTCARRIRHALLEKLAGPGVADALRIGRFRLAGEVHQWMYDRYSLSRLLILTGFRDPLVQSATSSQIPNWSSFNLDTRADGSVVKPDLFYMEAIKP